MPIYKKYKIFVFFILIFTSCDSDFKNIKRKNLRIDTITRSENDNFFENFSSKKNPSPFYSFEEDSSHYYKINKEFFRCKGNPLNLERIDERDKDNIKVYLDCEGNTKHSLPLIRGKEGIYSILIDILNYLQKKTKKKVIITCGHRCPKHNAYADILNDAKTSKHMIGAEVDFYVQGFEQTPEKIVDLIFNFYKENSKYNGNEEFEKFKTYEKSDMLRPPLYNKEIFVKIYEYNEGRDFNNRHPYPYISIQVLWDRETKEKVFYTWEKAHKGYLRY